MSEILHGKLISVIFPFCKYFFLINFKSLLTVNIPEPHMYKSLT